ncbi:ubiquitin-specific protease ubp1 [Saitoella coloradoensis]
MKDPYIYHLDTVTLPDFHDLTRLLPFACSTLLFLYIYLAPAFDWPSVHDLGVMLVDFSFATKRDKLKGVFGGDVVGMMRARTLSRSVVDIEREATVGGLVNSGNSCFLNSVLQAFASLDSIPAYLTSISSASPRPTPVSIALNRTLAQLNTSGSHTPRDVVYALSSNRRVVNNEQQDAQEFFQIITGALDDEAAKVSRRRHLGPGMSLKPNRLYPTPAHAIQGERERGMKSPFEGLMANRVGCLSCGYVEAIRHENFTNLSVPLPNERGCTLEQCLQSYTTLERIIGVPCRMCSIITTQKQLEKLISTSPTPLPALVEREELLRTAVDEWNPEHKVLKGVKLPVQIDSTKTKIAAIARGPQALILHINRSALNFTTGVVHKNAAAVSYAPVLDLSRYMSTHAALSTDPRTPLACAEVEGGENHDQYELKSVVVHYGSHSFGHYVAYRKTTNGWFRISDRDIWACTERDVLGEMSNVFMLMYEKMEAAVGEEVVKSSPGRHSMILRETIRGMGRHESHGDVFEDEEGEHNDITTH